MTNPNALTAAKFDSTIEWLRQQQLNTTNQAYKAELDKAIHQVRLNRKRHGFGY